MPFQAGKDAAFYVKKTGKAIAANGGNNIQIGQRIIIAVIVVNVVIRRYNVASVLVDDAIVMIGMPGRIFAYAAKPI